ncbi:RHS repeat-associated core domain-containing protein [uncultured Fluviicola sp.]|uniref:RHS repeat-associated core domain-containing protein n=1 Tax=uncultured Fluviicola sp. TaxID=463303 RepID=UPI0025F1A142|nr:RHS repeat-associated core domain-containing protein [uncultured Fluviicola sp.]
MFVVRFISLLVLLLVSLNASAVFIPHNTMVLTGSMTSGFTTITPPSWSLSPTVDLTRKGVITLGVDHHYLNHVNQSVTEVTISIVKYTAAGGSGASPETKTLKVSYYPIDSLTYVDENTITIDNVERMDITITQVKVNGVVQSPMAMPANLYLQADVFVDRIYDFTSQVGFNTYNLAAGDPLDMDCDLVRDEMTVSWDVVPGAEEYQLEWTFVNTVDLTTTEINNLNIDFRNNATRVSTKETSYKISLLFDQGYIVFRVRAVGRSSVPPYNFLFSKWSILDGPQILGLVPATSKQATEPFDLKKNWQYSATYAEEGKKKEVVSFYDGSLRNRQMVTKISTDHNAIVGETIYDHQGRPVIQVLPVPVTDPSHCDVEDTENSLKFYPDFNLNSSDQPYSKTDFDISNEENPCNPMQIDSMSASNGASKYYSTSNTDNAGSQAYVPNALGFPFSQVEYMPDNTGRIRRQGGVGKEFQLSTDIPTHPSLYYYAHPFQEQLDRLFGSEVGDASHYQKNMVVDPNGQVSVSYLDQEGRVVATSLAGEAPGNLQQLPSAAAIAPLTVDLFAKDANGNSTSNKLSFDGMSKEFNQTISLSGRTSLSISYDIEIRRFNTACLGEFCLNCVYDLSIEVRNLCGDLVSPVAVSSKMIGRFKELPSGDIQFLTDCKDTSFTTTFNTDTLEVGTYQITKILTVNEEALETYLQMYTDTSSHGINRCINQYDDILDQIGASSNINDCSDDFSCAECVTNLGSLLEYIQAGGTEEQYNFELESCNAPCKGASYYENMREILMVDVFPDGQYAQYLNNQNAVDPDMYPLSVLNDNTGGSTNRLPKTGAHWRNPRYDVEATIQNFYFEEDGVTKSRIYLENVSITSNQMLISTPLLHPTTRTVGTHVFLDNTTGTYYTYPQYLKSVSDFVTYYNANRQWGNSLVYYHPEYAYLKKYKEYYVKVNSSDPYTSESFDQKMMSVNTWADAITAGFINPNYASVSVNGRINNILTINGTYPWDPYSNYVNPSGMNSKLFNYTTINGVNYSMMETAAMMNRGGNSLIGTVPSATDLAFGLDVAGNTSTQNTQLRDAEWITFRGMYIAAKQELQYEAARASALSVSNPGYNGCIGDDSFNPFQFGFLTVFPGAIPYFGGQFFMNNNQPCFIATAAYYKYKQPRFGNQLANVNTDPAQVAYQAYLQTGQCPIATAFQRLLSEVASDHNLATTNFSASSTLANLSSLVMTINNFETPISIPNLTWVQNTGTTTSTTLEVDLMEGTFNYGTFQLVKASGSASYNWSDIISFNNLQFTGFLAPFYHFTIDVKVMISGEMVTQHLTGKTKFKIGNCNFPDVCKLNDFGKTLQNMVKTLAQMGTLTSTSYVDLTAIPYSNFMTNALKYTVNPAYSPGTTIKWKYDAAIPGFVLTDATNTITIKITGTDPGSFNLSSISTIAFIDELKAGANNTMELVCLNSSSNYLATLSCELLRSDNKAIPVGKCGLDDAILCTGLEYDTYEDLMAVLKFSLENQNSPFSLYNSPLWTSTLNDQLVPSPTAVTGTVTGTGVGAKLTYVMPDTCNLVLTYNGTNPNFHFNNIVSVNSINLLNQTVYGSYNDFKLYVTYSYGGSYFQDSIFGTSCFKLKRCTGCTQGHAGESGPAGSDQVDGEIDLGSLNDEEFTEADNNSETYCLDLYEDYVSAYNLFVAHQTTNPTCSNYASLYPMLTYPQFVDGRYCCGNNMLSAFRTILDLTTTTACPNNYSVADLCGEFNLSGGGCVDLHTIYTSVINYFNSSDWATTNNASLTAVASGVVSCKCEASYLNYLLEYLTADPHQNLSHPISIISYCALMDAEPENTCSSKYDQYVSCTNYFNDNNDSEDLAIVDYDVFMEQELCYCVDEYCSNLSLTLSHLASESRDLLYFCQSVSEIPCVVDTPMVSYESFEIDFEDPCVAFYESNNEVNAQNHFNEQIQDFYTQLGQEYIEHCMRSTENMSLSYREIEHHFTLYYYDQAGNLVKTIPPEGVEFVNMNDAQIRDGIKNDRLNNTHKVTTSHRMATTYLYNSLNQLVAQNMPDQDPIKVFEPSLPNGLPIALNTTGIQMIDANQGYLTGYINATGIAPLVNRGYLFKTSNGGLNWVRVTNTLGTDLREVYMVSATVGYALASNGLSLITKDGGNNWDLTDMPLAANYAEYVAMEVIGTDAYLLNRNGFIYKVNSSGVSSTYLGLFGTLPNPYSLVAVKDFTLQGSTTNFQGIIYLLTVSDGTETFDVTAITSNTSGNALLLDKTVVGNLQALSFYTTTAAIVGGNDGNTSRIDGTAAASFRQRLQKSDAKGVIDQIHMLNATVGIARITENGVKVIRKTTDGGTTWTALSSEYTDATLSFNRRTATTLEVLVQGYEAGTVNAAYSKNVVMNTSGICSELSQNPTMAQNINMSLVYTYNDGTNLTYYGLAYDNTLANYRLYKSNSFTTIGSNVSFTPIVDWVGGSIIPKELVVAKSGSEIAVEVVADNGNLYRSQSSGAVTSFSLFSAVSGMTSIVSMDKITISSIDHIVAYRSSDTRLYVRAATGASAYVYYGGTPALSGSVITKIAAHGSNVTLIGTNGGIFTSTGVNFVPPSNGGGTALVFTDRKSHQLYGLTEMKYTPSMNLIAGENGQAYTRPIFLTGTSTSQLRPLGITSDLCAMNQVTYGGNTHYVYGGKNGDLAMIQSNGTLAPTLYTTTGSSVKAHLSGQTINDIAVLTTSGVSKVCIVGDNGALYYTTNISTESFMPAISQTNRNFLGASIITGTDKVMVVGTGTEIFRYSQNIGTRINRVFGPKYNDVHFENGQIGTLIGDNYFVRSTLNGGLDWKIIKPTTGPGITGLKKVWTKSKPNGEHFALIGGVNYYLKADNGTVAEYAISGTVNDIQFSKVNPLFGYMAFNSTLAKVNLTLLSGTYTITPSNVYTAANTIRGLHVFENTSAIMVGDGGGIYYYRNDPAALGGYSLATVSGVTFRDVYFIDNKVGLAVGDAGKIYSLSSSSNAPYTHDILSGGFGYLPESITDPEFGTTLVSYNITALAFSSSTSAIYGGSFVNASDVTSRGAMVRYLKYEKELFTSRFYYDRLGRIVVSQNSRQAGASGITDDKYSYTVYDGLGRVKEAGEKSENTSGIKFAGIFGTNVGGTTVPNVVDDANLGVWLSNNAVNTRKEVTKSYYDETNAAINSDLGFTSTTLNKATQRKRIVHVTYSAVYSASDNVYDHATHYDYDIHGNVKTLYQDNRLVKVMTNLSAQRIKKLDYIYDLISGNVHRVDYQTGQSDQWHHAYAYDADNRITDVYTTVETPLTSEYSSIASLQNEPEISTMWDREVNYLYYEHGPLARTIIGDQEVQGVDYVYTLQGWIKGVNSNTLDVNRDPGQDGAAGDNKFIAHDVFGYSLHYFDGDYGGAIGGNNSFVATQTAGSGMVANSNQLYNGNIGRMVTTITDPDTREVLPLGNAYKYDQLNRLYEARSFNNINLATNSWNTGGTTMYYNQFTYDANGNIMTQVRYDETASGIIDQLSYQYKDAAGAIGTSNPKKHNRLYNVQDAYDYPEGNDIRIGQASNNYSYDAEGRLIYDKQEGRVYNWRVDGKLESTYWDPNSGTPMKRDIYFDYDAMGHRIAKHISNEDAEYREKSIYYVLDAQGNVMSVYERIINNLEQSVSFTQTEKHIYGSSRLGVHNERIELLGTQNETYSMANIHHHIGDKTYELSNHLGNVLSVVSDKVLPVSDQTSIYSNDFSSGLGGFINDPGVVLSLVGGQLQVSNVPTHYCTRRSLNSLTTAGHSYKVRFKIDLNGSGPVSAYTAISSTIFGIVNCSGNGTYEFTYTPTGTTFTNLYLRFESMGGAVSPRTFYIDDVSIEDITVTGYLADIRQSTDYSPFGVKLHKRDLELTGSNSAYRYAFNGYEGDNEVKGDGNSYTTEFRQYDPRLGRWLSMDPFSQFVGSQYTSFNNNPIFCIDPDGGWVPVIVEHKTIEDHPTDKAKYIQKTTTILAAKFEEGDDAKSLAKFLDIPEREAEKLFQNACNLAESEAGKYIPIPEDIAGSINTAIQNTLKGNSEEYNCWASAIYTSQGRFPLENGAEKNYKYGTAKDFDDRLEEPDYKNVSTKYNEWTFGRTIFKFRNSSWDMMDGTQEKTTHGCIFLGYDKKGTMYFFTKNGWDDSPCIMTSEEVSDMYGFKRNGQKAYNYIGQ